MLLHILQPKPYETRSLHFFLDNYRVPTFRNVIIFEKIDLLAAGYSLIYSNVNALYLDCGYGFWTSNAEGPNWCSPYKDWKVVYDYNILLPVSEKFGSLYTPVYENGPSPRELVLGASASLWSETADGNSAESKIFPRASALAERLWTNPSNKWTEEVTNRLLGHREFLVKRGIAADSIAPVWCYLNDGEC